MRWTVAVATLLMLLGCHDGRKALMLESVGKPYEVLVVCDDSTMAALVRAELETPVYGLPQAEPSFDVSTVDTKHLSATLRTTRNLVMVGKGNDNDIRIRHDVYAQPQIEVLVSAPSAQQLSRLMREKGQQLRKVLTHNEMKAAHEQLERHHNAEAERTIRQLFGVEMLIPADMTSSKRGKDFLWLSNNSPDAMQNVCIYIYKKGTDLHNVRWVALRDSVMRANIPGEEPGMYMHTVNEPYERQVIGRMEGQRYSFCGLWEMTGDMMGGPFSCVAIADTARQRIIVAEAFVYAPGRSKRNLMMALQPVVSSINIHQK